MRACFLKYISIFFLVVFAHALIQQEIHALEHADDFHCKSVSEKHIHEQEHDCSLCDFTFASSVIPDDIVTTSLFSTNSEEIFLFLNNHYASYQGFSYTLRGPPEVV